MSFAGIPAGADFTYRFPIRQSGTYWAHSHSGAQELLGLYLPLIIDPIESGKAHQSHADVQGQLRDLGFLLCFEVWIASNDQSRAYQNGTLGEGCLTTLPSAIQTIAGGDAVRLIDVLWLEERTHVPVAAFEVEHSTSIYSCIVRMLDLALGFNASNCPIRLFLVAPDKRADEVRSQLRGPAFSMVQDTTFSFIPYRELKRHLEPMSRFGQALKAIEAISEKLNPRLIAD